MSSRDPGSNDRSGSPPTEQQEPFLQRWSRRKAQARHELEPPAETATGPPPEKVENDDAAPAPVLTDDDMPALDTLNEASDVSGFMSPGVSEKLRRAALRKVFSMAVYNVRDGLDDYDDDFTAFEPLGDTVTADMKHRQEMLEKRRREREEAERLAAEQAEQEQAAAQTADEQTADEWDAASGDETPAAAAQDHLTGSDEDSPATEDDDDLRHT